MVAETKAQPEDLWLSGESGSVEGVRANVKAVIRDLLLDAHSLLTNRTQRLSKARRSHPQRRVLVVAVDQPEIPGLLQESIAELQKTKHQLTVETCTGSGRGKFENLNLLMQRHDLNDFDWVIAVDDDVSLPKDFLDNFLFLAESFALKIAQPAHRHRSHAAWRVTRRQRSLLRETAFVETGPVTAFHRDTFGLFPFPPLRMGWGLDSNWSALAAQHRWKIGVVDATPIQHIMRPINASYRFDEAVAEGRNFLANNPHLTRDQAQQTYVSHRRL